MTTAIIVDARHGRAIRVTELRSALVGGALTEVEYVVEAGASRSFVICDGLDLRLHELAPNEAPPPLPPPPDP